MNAARTTAPDEATVPAQDPDKDLRRCLARGEERPKAELIRFVVGPDHRIVPDVAGKLPGRGLWVSADRDAVDQAARKNLFAKAAKASVLVATDLADQVASLLRRRCLDLLGLAKGAGIAVLGETQVETALKAKQLSLLLMADDAGQTLHPADDIQLFRCFTRGELGGAFGFAQIVYAGLRPHKLTARIAHDIKRLAGFSGQNPDSLSDKGKTTP